MADIGVQHQRRTYQAPFKLSYVDFTPRCAGAGGVICTPDYERFELVATHTHTPTQATHDCP